MEVLTQAIPARVEGQRLRLPGLDLIRAVAIGWVMVYHAMNFHLIPDADHWVVKFGWMGVDLFFVLSGFLIASQLLRPWAGDLRPDYVRFFSRRLLRTFPAYAVVVGVYFLIPALREKPDIQPLWQFLTFTENLLYDTRSVKAFSQVWSLCVEEQFYLVIPLAVTLLAVRPTTRKTATVLVVILVFGMMVRGYLWLAKVSETPFDVGAAPHWRPYMTLIYYPTWSRLDGLLAGVTAATIKIFRPDAWKQLTAKPDLLLLCGLVGVGASMLLFKGQFASFIATIFGFPLLAFSIALIVAAGAEPRSIISRYKVPGATMLATGAYSLYLTQKIAYHLVDSGVVPSFDSGGWLRFAIAIATALVLGAALYWTVERPFLKLRECLDGPSRRSVAARQTESCLQTATKISELT
jgi:peptidoglycan/LPS O-acetylase OafA/YrhL